MDSKQGNIILSGIVDVLSEKNFAEEIAKKIDGVVSIENSITIGMDSNITDSHIRHEIENKIYQGEESRGLLNVGIDVKGGTAVLMGRVEDESDKRKAAELASSARGVVNVVDSIKIYKTYTLWALCALLMPASSVMTAAAAGCKFGQLVFLKKINIVRYCSRHYLIDFYSLIVQLCQCSRSYAGYQNGIYLFAPKGL